MARTLRTYLCPACDGWGCYTTNASRLGDPQQEVDRECAECEGTGVVQAARGAEGLQPWTGDQGRSLCRLRPQRFDWFAELRKTRALCVKHHVRSLPYLQARGAVCGKSHGYALLDAKAERIASERHLAESQARMLAAADGCAQATGTALAAWRSVA